MTYPFHSMPQLTDKNDWCFLIKTVSIGCLVLCAYWTVSNELQYKNYLHSTIFNRTNQTNCLGLFSPTQRILNAQCTTWLSQLCYTGAQKRVRVCVRWDLEENSCG